MARVHACGRCHCSTRSSACASNILFLRQGVRRANYDAEFDGAHMRRGQSSGRRHVEYIPFENCIEFILRHEPGTSLTSPLIYIIHFLSMSTHCRSNVTCRCRTACNLDGVHDDPLSICSSSFDMDSRVAYVQEADIRLGRPTAVAFITRQLQLREPCRMSQCADVPGCDCAVSVILTLASSNARTRCSECLSDHVLTHH